MNIPRRPATSLDGTWVNIDLRPPVPNRSMARGADGVSATRDSLRSTAEGQRATGDDAAARLRRRLRSKPLIALAAALVLLAMLARIGASRRGPAGRA